MILFNPPNNFRGDVSQSNEKKRFREAEEWIWAPSAAWWQNQDTGPGLPGSRPPMISTTRPALPLPSLSPDHLTWDHITRPLTEHLLSARYYKAHLLLDKGCWCCPIVQRGTLGSEEGQMSTATGPDRGRAASSFHTTSTGLSDY